MRTKEELFRLELPKWPQMIVTGESIPVTDALEIIRRTDRFFYTCLGGNNERFNKLAKKAVFYPEYDEDETFGDHWKKNTWWREHWGHIDLNYVLNDWVSCAFVNGPHGWCHPNGSIGFIDNVGKWPEVEEVYEDWVKIATAFPFVKVEATLMDREKCEDGIKPVVSFLIRNGKVEIIDPQERNLHNEFGRKILKEMTDEEWSQWFRRRMADESYENAIPIEQIELWGRRFMEAVGGLPWERQ